MGENASESLSQLARLGARLIIQQAAEQEFDASLGSTNCAPNEFSHPYRVMPARRRWPNIVGWCDIEVGMGIERRSGRKLIAGVVVVAASLLVFASVVQAAAFKARNWSNTPVRHTLKQRIAPTVPSFAANLRGGVAVTGNTLETCPANSPGSEACTTANNNDENMEYVDVDPGGQRFNSSTANLTVPAGAQVVKAFLYWAGDLSRGVVNGSNKRTGSAAPDGDTPKGQLPHAADTPHQINDLYGTVELRVGGTRPTARSTRSTRIRPRADGTQLPAGIRRLPRHSKPEGGSPGWAYQVRADVTDQISAGLTSRARRKGAKSTLPVTVANVQAGTGLNRYAGWNLIVVWEQPTAAWRDITLFDGFDWVQVAGGQQLVVGPLDFTGFRTPSSGNIDAHVTVWATEGDRGLTGDYMSLGNQSPTCDPLAKQHDAAHPVDNFFNSTISTGGVDVGGRTPNYSNQLGFDLATLAVPEGTIGNNQTGASVCLGTTGDTYFFGGLVFDTLIKAPNLEIAKVSDHANASPGAVVNYTTTVSNPKTRDPSDPLHDVEVTAATNVVVADQLPSGLDFDGFTQGGDKCAYGAASTHDHLHRRDPRARRHVHVLLQGGGGGERAGPQSRPTHQQCLLRRELRGSAGRRVPRLRPGDRHCSAHAAGAPTRRPRRSQDGLGRGRQAGRHGHLEDRRDEPRAGDLDRLHACRSASAGRAVRKRNRQSGADLHDASRGHQRISHLHRAERSRRARSGIVSDAHDRRDGAGHHR